LGILKVKGKDMDILPTEQYSRYAFGHNNKEVSGLMVGDEVHYANKTYIVKKVDRRGFYRKAFLVGKTGIVSEKRYIHITDNIVEERQVRYS
jgi:hypothetical protein